MHNAARGCSLRQLFRVLRKELKLVDVKPAGNARRVPGYNWPPHFLSITVEGSSREKHQSSNEASGRTITARRVTPTALPVGDAMSCSKVSCFDYDLWTLCNAFLSLSTSLLWLLPVVLSASSVFLGTFAKLRKVLNEFSWNFIFIFRTSVLQLPAARGDSQLLTIRTQKCPTILRRVPSAGSAVDAPYSNCSDVILFHAKHSTFITFWWHHHTFLYALGKSADGFMLTSNRLLSSTPR
jgi:hypothetical protein